MKAWLTYTLARLGIFAAVLAILLVIGVQWAFATIGAALISLLVSYIALPKLRWQVATSLAERRQAPEHDEDADYEDDFVDAEDTPGQQAAPRQAAPQQAAPQPSAPQQAAPRPTTPATPDEPSRP
ncbi:DUF4229 domain-containing protein [Curtobacterium sp. Leaf261]|uniref:DUF4229 domain-containing protein n=1 Tax=Curtobacterium sp. Leaf261 TaxID=1736311 RepID=UPI0006F641F4|nr:DUF4229 domain-containing protein [Curtobacterium sp. Leaf261]KQO62345.1 hypothetical protein ASF23_11190 [Curtobacterium sp. Leaf261]